MNFKDLLNPREFVAELLGTFLLTVMAKGAAVSLGGLAAPPAVGNLIGSLTAGIGVMMGILITGGASGGHINPAVSVGMVAGRRLRLTLLPAYLAGQYLGAFVGGCLVVGLYSDVLKDDGTVRLVATQLASSPGLSSNATSLFFDQLTATFFLILLITAVVEQGHQPGGLLVGLSVAGIGCCLGPNAGAAMNPAVDLMPRIVAAIWEGSGEAFTSSSHFWVIPFVVPHLAGIIAVLSYDWLIVKMRSEEVKEQPDLPLEEKPCLGDNDVEKSE